MSRLFVYGTLMKNECNHHYLKDDWFVGEGVVKDFELLELNGFPGMVHRSKGMVRGEVYEIDEEVKRELDLLEGDMYTYRKTEAIVHGEKMEVYYYEFNQTYPAEKRAIVNQHKWVSHVDADAYVWYVCYGSNLLEERFAIYIEKTHSKQPPLMHKTYMLPYELYFAKKSHQWEDEGVAFLDVETNGKTYGKAYLIHKDQLEDIRQIEGATWYGNMVHLGEDDYGISYVTLTGKECYEKTMPSQLYLDVLGAGLQETYQLEIKEILDYLHVTFLDLTNIHIHAILKARGGKGKRMKFRTLDFRKEVNHAYLSQMEQELLKYENYCVRDISKDEREDFEDMLEDFVAMQGEYGFFPLVVDDAIPNDCMYYYNRKPTYIILSLLMQNKNPKHEEVIERALEGCLLSRFYGTSYEAEIQQMENLSMLIRSGLLYYANEDMWSLVYELVQRAKHVVKTSSSQWYVFWSSMVLSDMRGMMR